MPHNGVVIDAKAGQTSLTAYTGAWPATVRAVNALSPKSLSGDSR